MKRVGWILGVWVFLGACAGKEEEACPAGQAMDAAGDCLDVAGSGGDEPDPGPGVGADTDSESAPEEDSGEPDEPLSVDGLERVQSVFPTAVGMRIIPIPAERNSANDLEHGNTSLGRVLDDAGETLGYVRRIFTPVYCVAGVCEAIQFAMAFTPEYRPLAVYHPDNIEHRLMKYFDGFYEPFNADDWVLLNTVFVDPPDAYAPVETVEEMVEGTHGTAPTLPEFQPITVRGAVFTVWYIIRYGQQTETLLNAMGATRAQP